jgi:hypothetical protein
VATRDVVRAFVAENPALARPMVRVQCTAAGRIAGVQVCLDRQLAFRRCTASLRGCPLRRATMDGVAGGAVGGAAANATDGASGSAANGTADASTSGGAGHATGAAAAGADGGAGGGASGSDGQSPGDAGGWAVRVPAEVVAIGVLVVAAAVWRWRAWRRGGGRGLWAGAQASERQPLVGAA